MANLDVLYTLGLGLVVVGIVIVIIAMVILYSRQSKCKTKTETHAAGVIMIGPIPIVFGSGPNLPWLIAISLAISVISIIAFIILNRRR